MSSNKRKFFKRIIFPLLISLFFLMNNIKCSTILKINLEKDDECSNSLECKTGCCNSGKCSDTGDCSVTKVYTIQIIVCVVLVAIFIVYLVVQLRKINEDFKEKQGNLNKQNQMNKY